MVSTRASASAAEDDHGSDDTFRTKNLPNYGEVMKRVDKLKSQRIESRKKLIAIHQKKVAAVKARIMKEQEAQREALSTLKSSRTQRLLDALEKIDACTQEIINKVEYLKDDRDHLAMLIDAIYKARRDSAEDMRAGA